MLYVLETPTKANPFSKTLKNGGNFVKIENHYSRKRFIRQICDL